MKVAVVVQARLGSTRLPGKILLPLAGRPLLERMLERVRSARTPFELIVATTSAASDDAVAELAAGMGVRTHRGHPTDLLDRHYQAVQGLGAEVVVKIPSDCPLIDPSVIDEVLGAWSRAPFTFDYLSNLHPPTWPDGNDVEVMTMDALETAWREAKKPHEREHTTPFLWDQPERFRIGNVTWTEDGHIRDLSQTHRFTIDYLEDYELLSGIYDALYQEARPVFPLGEVLALLEARPDLYATNAKYRGVNWYRHHLGELRTVSACDTRSPEVPS